MESSPGPALLTGRYVLGELIGEGGSAKVYRATDTALARDVAVKLLHAHVLENDRRRFEREIRTLARVSHPGVVAIHDLGRDGQGQLFFTMQLLLGGPLSVLGPLDGAPQTLQQFFEAATFVARTLDFVHAKGVIHRDLTPHNILLGEDGIPRVMDFGLVYLSEGTRDLTRAGYTLGTPQYMAPEQAKGGFVGPHSDLYALGAVLYRVATGRPPFDGESDQAVLYQHVYERPTPPHEVNPAVPLALSHTLLQLLEKRPEVRPESGAHLAELLRLARDDEGRRSSGGQFRGGWGRAGEYQGGPRDPASLRERWSVTLGGEVTWPAAVTAGGPVIAVGTRRSRLSLVDRSGRRYADLSAADEVTAPATVEEDHAVYGSWDGSLRRVTLEGGEERWRHKTRAEITGAPTLWQAHYLVTSRDGHLHCVGRERGDLQWAYRAGAPIAASPVIWAGTAFVADEEGWIHAVDASLGSVLWKVQLSTVHATPALAHLGPREAALIVPAWNGEAHALHLTLQQGRPTLAEEPLLWIYDLEHEMWASPAADTQRVYLATWDGTVHALTLRGADEVWTRKLQGRVTASPVLAAGTLYVASEAGEVEALSARTGEVLWSARFEHGVQATPLVHDGTLYVAFMNGTLRAFR
ncbi:PQQ-binding-like beta-propeller repeat protein [Deinococcus peraridilitoris]|uniref:Protein kinase family protein n=1 Tax=Deinococcus peraridilitoris (strain DSM 19664 / LMG 22246 / CIP 109416 / KR-200) TaxID=937777 RepID=K9ZXW5_DEIPD|nr:serine/threonine-protein kinase [Deinococcus peraridilitoris]AFZ66034.1 protein kinase family protein [Deinococcus peraridilitoris DSM 19664]